MNGEHRDAEFLRLPHGMLHGVRDVVKLHVEKHAMTVRDDIANERRAVGQEGLESDLDRARGVPQLGGESADLVRSRKVGGDDEPVTRLHRAR